MRTVDAHLLGDKMDDAVTHYINTHQPGEHVHIDTDGMPMSVQDDGSRITIMHHQNYSSHLCRQVTEQVGDGPWGEELLDPEGRIAAIVAQLASSRTSHPHPHHKVSARNEVDTSVILDSSIRFNGQNLNQQSVSLAGLPPIQTLPLQEMKRCETDWFNDKNKKSESQIGPLTDSDGPVLDLPSGSPAHSRQQNRKSLPHKKRISRKLKRNNGGSTPQQDLLVINNIEPVVAPVVEEEQILPDNYVPVPQQAHHIPHEVRPILICQICGGFYGEEQLKFFQHLKQHYEPHNIILDSPVADLVMDKITNTCIVDNVAQLPDSIVELSLENTVPKTMYQPMDKHHAHSNIVPLNYNNMKVHYSMASVDKDTPVEAEKADLYETLDKLEFYNCGKCSKTFRKQKQCEAHMREAHPINTKLEDMGEFSEPEDLMAGIHVCVGEYEPPLLPHLTVDNGHVTQDHTRHWYSRNGTQLDPCDSCNECTNEGYCAGCDRDNEHHTQTHHTQPHHTQPHHSQPHHTQPHHTQSHHTQPHHTQSHHTQPHHTQPHHTQPHHSQSIHVSEQHMESHQSHDSHSQHDSHSHEPQPLKILKEEVLQRIFESEVPTPIAYSSIIHEQPNEHEDDHEPSPESNDHSNDHDNHNDHNEHANSNDVNDYERKHNVGESEKKWITVTIEGPTGTAKGNGKRKRLECSECGRVFSHRNSLMYHMLSHAARQHACPHCDKTFFTAGALKIHKRVHNGDKPYKCELCERRFRQWSDLKYHNISLHSNQKHFKCEFCGKEFARKYSLNLHRRIHTGERNYKCDYCTKTFSASSYRLTHMRTHTGDRPFKCDQCEKSFRSGFDLRRHCQVHEKVRNRFEENKPKPKDKKTKTDKDEKPTPPKERKQIKSESPEPPKKSPKKKSAFKKGAPNVTVQNRDGQFKIDCPNTHIEPFEHTKNVQYTKFKVVYEDEEFKDPTPYKSQPYRDSDREMAVVRSIRDDRRCRENTDGKLQIFTHIEKGKEYSGSIVSNSQVLGDIRHLEREVAREVRADGSMHGEAENVFIERLTALYNVPA